ncbi:MAG: hypothetical protein QNL71_13365 [Akkermansiaceae bacterium]
MATADELPPQVKVLQLKLKEKLESSNQDFLDELDQLVIAYTQKEKFVWAAQAKEARDRLAQGKLNPDENLPSAVESILTKQKKMEVVLDRIYMSELDKIRKNFVKAGKLEEVNQMALLIAQIEAKAGRDDGLAELLVESNVKIEIKEMRPGRARLYGAFRPSFKSFDARLRESVFTRIPWQSTPSFVIEALSDGNFYVGVPKNDQHEVPDPKEEIPDLAKGDYLGNFVYYRIYLKEGAKFQFKGYEAFMAAGKIETR